MRHVLLFAVLSLSTVTFAADKLPEKKAPKPSDKAAKKKPHALPAGATATVVVFDYAGGMRAPKNNDPLMVIRADGSVTLGNRYRKNARIETRITKDDLQALLRLAIDTNDFFKINAAEIGQSIDAKVKRENEKLAAKGVLMVGPNRVADGATTVVRIHADGKDHQVKLYDLRGKSRFLRNDERLTRLQNIVTRLGEVERKLRAGGAKAKPEAAKKTPAPLTLVVKGPFADSKQTPFGKTDCTFVQPLSVELRDEEDCSLLRVRFRFVGRKDLASGIRVAISPMDDLICADRRFLTRMPLWAGTKDDQFVGMAEFALPPDDSPRAPRHVRKNLDRLQVTFSRVRLVEDAAKPLTQAAWTKAIALIAKLDDKNSNRAEAAGRELAALGKPSLPYLEMLDHALAEHPKAPQKLRAKLGTIETAIHKRNPDRNIKAMKRRISVNFVKTPLSKVLESISSKSGVAVVLDPEVNAWLRPRNPSWKVGDYPISFRADNMEVDLLLGSICRSIHIGQQMEYVVRSSGVVVTSTVRARMLRKLARPAYQIAPRFPARFSL